MCLKKLHLIKMYGILNHYGKPMEKPQLKLLGDVDKLVQTTDVDGSK